MKKAFVILILLFTTYFDSYGQSIYTQTIKGTVVDKETDYPLIGVNVVLRNGSRMIGSTSDVDGMFVLENVPIGRQTIQFSYIGYETTTVPNISVTSAKETVLYIQLQEDLVQVKSVEIIASKDRRKPINEMACISSRSISMEEVTKFSGTMGDVARMAQNYAGVSGATDDRNDIIVRGNSPSTVLYRMEGVDIPAPNHWASIGAAGGPISMINANNLRNSDFLSGAFPAEYGNAIGAVFDLKLRNGNTGKYEFLGQIGFNGVELGAEGPLNIGKNASFVTNYRYSTLGVFQALGFDFGTGGNVPEYQDATFKINVPTKKMGRFILWGIGGISYIDLKTETDKDNLYLLGDQNATAGSKTGILGASHLYFFDNKTSSNLAITWSGTINKSTVEELKSEQNNFTKIFSSSNYTGRLGVNWTLNKKINSKNRIKSGIIYDNYNLNIVDSILLDSNHWFRELDFIGRTSMYRAFAQWQYKFNEKLTMNTGIHGTYFALNDGYSIDPRFNLSYEWNDKLTFALGYGRHAQLQPLPIYFNKDVHATPEKNAKNLQLDMMKSHHFVASMDYLFTKSMRVKLEAYYQSLSDLAVSPEIGGYSSINIGANFDFANYTGLENGGAGKNKGIELTVERFLKKGLYTLFTASIFDSKYKGYDQIEHNTYYNSHFVFNFLVGKEFVFHNKNVLSIDTKVNYAGGRRFTPIDIEASKRLGREVLDNSRQFESQYAPYIRPDIKIGFRKNGRKTSHRWYIDFQNVINYQNEFYHFYNEKEEKVKTIYQRGFFPDISYQMLF